MRRVITWDSLNLAAICIGSLALSVIFLMFLPRDLGAQGNRAFTVSGVQVDVTSSSSADARKKALADGQRRAFERLLRRLVMSDDINRLPKMASDEIDEYVLEFAVDNEKNSPVRYLADLTFRFKPTLIRNLLRNLLKLFIRMVRERNVSIFSYICHFSFPFL